MSNQKNLEDQTLMDDYMFAQVMRNPEHLKPLLEYILDIRISAIRLIDLQKSVKEGYDSHGIRLDVYVEDQAEVIYNVEVQVEGKKNLPKRMRYYQSILDNSILREGMDYNLLRESFVIFLCSYDPFRQGRYIYSFENMCREAPGLLLGDAAHKVVVNIKGTMGDISDELKEVITYLDSGEVTGAYSRELDEAVNTVKASEEKRLEYMLMWVRDNEIRAEGRVEGLEEGRILEAVELYREEMHLGDQEIIEKLMTRFQMDKGAAEAHLHVR